MKTKVNAGMVRDQKGFYKQIADKPELQWLLNGHFSGALTSHGYVLAKVRQFSFWGECISLLILSFLAFIWVACHMSLVGGLENMKKVYTPEHPILTLVSAVAIFIGFYVAGQVATAFSSRWEDFIDCWVRCNWRYADFYGCVQSFGVDNVDLLVATRDELESGVVPNFATHLAIQRLWETVNSIRDVEEGNSPSKEMDLSYLKSERDRHFANFKKLRVCKEDDSLSPIYTEVDETRKWMKKHRTE